MSRAVTATVSTVLFISLGFIRCAQADWTQYALPDLSLAWGATALGHLSNGRYVFGECGNMYQQDAWNNASYSAYANEPGGIDPSFIGVWDDATAAIGAGGWGASSLYTFTPSSTASSFSDIGLTLQNYHGVFRDAGSLYTGGGDTGPGSDHHGIRYVSLDGSTNKIIIDDISAYSTGFDSDSTGNLYVGDNDDGRVYRFTKAQLDGAISGSALSIADGTFIYDFGGGGDIGSLAVDGYGRLWGAGWQHNGLMVYNPAIGEQYTYIPGLDNANYKVASFMHGGEHYVAYMNQADPSSGGSAQYYGFDLAGNYAIPEPTSIVLLAVGIGLVWTRMIAVRSPIKRRTM